MSPRSTKLYFFILIIVLFVRHQQHQLVEHYRDRAEIVSPFANVGFQLLGQFPDRAVFFRGVGVIAVDERVRQTVQAQQVTVQSLRLTYPVADFINRINGL